MAKEKKSKTDSKKAKLLEKKAKQEKKGEKKAKVKSARANDSDNEDVDLDAILAEYVRKQEQFLKVTESVCEEPPRARASSTFIASPASQNELFLFGGEYFNGALAMFFNEMHVYVINKDEWRLVTSPNTPLPRSGHAWCRGLGGGIYLFGGEFSSPKQGTFYHYNDFWRFEPSTREWTRLVTKGKSPPARSGHRMVYFKNYIILFGGFQDTSQQTKYLADLWIYDTHNFVWHNPAVPLATQKPDPRSSFTFLPHETGAVLYGGYSRIKTSVSDKQRKGGGPVQRNVIKPLVHLDCFFLRVIQPNTEVSAMTPPTVRWERRKKPSNAPYPARAGATMVYHKGRGILFGGVHDVEESEEAIDSEFFNNLFAWNIEQNRFFPLTLRKSRTPHKTRTNERAGRRGRGQANEEDLLRNLAALNTDNGIEDRDIEPRVEDGEEVQMPLRELSLELPHPRFNAQLAVQDDVLYIHGGTYETEDREYTFDEMYAIDLVKLDGVREVFRREPQNWIGAEDEESDEDEDDGSSGEDGEDDEFAEAGEGEVTMADKKHLHSESKRRIKQESRASIDELVMEASSAPSSVFDDTPDDNAVPRSADDNLPHPRPFESRREFFQRSGNEWQEVLMASLRWKGMQPESLSVKEIKSKAYEMSEEKWWECREEILVLEEEQEVAGVGEVVALAERGDAIGGAGRRR